MNIFSDVGRGNGESVFGKGSGDLSGTRIEIEAGARQWRRNNYCIEDAEGYGVGWPSSSRQEGPEGGQVDAVGQEVHGLRTPRMRRHE